MTDDELMTITEAIKQTVENIDEWKLDYLYNKHINEFHHISYPEEMNSDYSSSFSMKL